MKLNLKKTKAAAGPATEKKAKRKSRGGGGDSAAKMKAFLAEHVEKLLLGTIALVSLYLVYAGFAKEKLGKGPEDVSRAISTAENSMASETWATVKAERFPEPDTFDQQATLDTIDLAADSYAINQPFFPRMQDRGKLRTDPEILAPFDLEVKTGYGALAVRPTGQEQGGGSNRSMMRNDPDLRAVPDSPFRSQSGRGSRGSGGSYEERFFAVVTGLVPVKQQFDIYQEAFKDAAEYVPERDTPRYLGLEIERAEVQADGSLGSWEPVDTKTAMMSEWQTWEGTIDEMADARYKLNALVMPLPPIAFRDVSNWATHSQVPLQRPEDVRGEGARPQSGVGAEEGASPAAANLQWSLQGAGGGRRGEEGGRGRASATSMSEERGSGAREGQGVGEIARPPLEVENGMLRYFDFHVEPGKQYKYRARLVLEDPNDPLQGQRPSPASCDTDVLIRRQTDTDQYQLSDWSSASEAARVPTGSMVLAGSVDAPRERPFGSRQIRMVTSAVAEPEATVLALSWNRERATDVPIAVEARRGAVLNGTTDTEALDPAVSQLRKLENYRFDTGAVVVDILGGTNLDSIDLPAPGHVLVMTDDGQLRRQSELADYVAKQRNTFEKEIEAPLPTGAEGVEDRGRFDEGEMRGERGRGGGRGTNNRNNPRNRGGFGGR